MEEIEFNLSPQSHGGSVSGAVRVKYRRMGLIAAFPVVSGYLLQPSYNDLSATVTVCQEPVSFIRLYVLFSGWKSRWYPIHSQYINPSKESCVFFKELFGKISSRQL